MSKNLVVRHVTRPCPCMTTSIIIKITRVISMWTLHWITVSCHGVESPMTTGYYCAIFPFCGRGKKKKDDKKTKADWATTGIPVITCVLHALLCLPINVRFFPPPPPQRVSTGIDDKSRSFNAIHFSLHKQLYHFHKSIIRKEVS